MFWQRKIWAKSTFFLWKMQQEIWCKFWQYDFLKSFVLLFRTQKRKKELVFKRKGSRFHMLSCNCLISEVIVLTFEEAGLMLAVHTLTIYSINTPIYKHCKNSEKLFVTLPLKETVLNNIKKSYRSNSNHNLTTACELN